MCRVTTLNLLTFALWSPCLLHHYKELANWYLTSSTLDTSFNSVNFLKCIHVDSSYPEPSAGMLSQASFFLVVLALASCTSCCRNGSKHHKLLCIWLQLCDIMLARHSTVAHVTFHCSVVLHAAVSQSNMLFLVNTCTRFSWIRIQKSIRQVIVKLCGSSRSYCQMHF